VAPTACHTWHLPHALCTFPDKAPSHFSAVSGEMRPGGQPTYVCHIVLMWANDMRQQNNIDVMPPKPAEADASPCVAVLWLTTLMSLAPFMFLLVLGVHAVCEALRIVMLRERLEVEGGRYRVIRELHGLGDRTGEWIGEIREAKGWRGGAGEVGPSGVGGNLNSQHGGLQGVRRGETSPLVSIWAKCSQMSLVVLRGWYFVG
jgi:hypothetical protein